MDFEVLERDHIIVACEEAGDKEIIAAGSLEPEQPRHQVTACH